MLRYLCETPLTSSRAREVTAKSSRQGINWKSDSMPSRRFDCCRPIMLKRFCAKYNP
jgi:hypothetical protein